MDLVFFQNMLEYENEMFLSAVQEDGLTIVAKGLGLENVFTNLLKVPHYMSGKKCKEVLLWLKKIQKLEISDDIVNPNSIMGLCNAEFRRK